VLITAGVFVAVPLGVCVGGAFVLGLLGRRRGETVTVAQLLSFGSALVLINVVVMVAGVVLRAVWGCSGKVGPPLPPLPPPPLLPFGPLLVGSAPNGVVDGVVTAVILRAQLRPRREGAG